MFNFISTLIVLIYVCASHCTHIYIYIYIYIYGAAIEFGVDHLQKNAVYQIE